LLRFFIGAAYLFFGFTHSNQSVANPAAQGKYQEKQEGFKSKIEDFKEQHGKQSSALRLHACALHKHAQLSSARVTSLVKTRYKNFGFILKFYVIKQKIKLIPCASRLVRATKSKIKKKAELKKY